jgi:hypothetical protein
MSRGWYHCVQSMRTAPSCHGVESLATSLKAGEIRRPRNECPGPPRQSRFRWVVGSDAYHRLWTRQSKFHKRRWFQIIAATLVCEERRNGFTLWSSSTDWNRNRILTGILITVFYFSNAPWNYLLLVMLLFHSGKPAMRNQAAEFPPLREAALFSVAAGSRSTLVASL